MSRKTVALLLFSVIIEIMLEKYAKNMQKNADFSQKMFFDAHFHYAVCLQNGIKLPDFADGIEWSGISCAHSKEEYEIQKEAPATVIQAYGMHPQNAANENIKESADFLENLLSKNLISFIGEAGFDYFSDEYKNAAGLQEEIWNIQLDLALSCNIPLVIHCRKANHKLFEYSKKLKKLPEVLFHSFMGPPIEARALLERGINGYFSFGKQLLNGNKKAIACVKELPPDRILAETDAPFQFLKGEKYTDLKDIQRVYAAMDCFAFGSQ